LFSSGNRDFFEYLIRVLLFRPGRKLPWYQFSLAGMLMLTACMAGACAWLKILGPAGIFWLIIGLLIFACLLEWWIRNVLRPNEWRQASFKTTAKALPAPGLLSTDATPS
jgi:hypothetical protein